jgi:DNA polymerase-3 subunit alpha
MAGDTIDSENEIITKARKEPEFVDFVHLHNHTHYSLLDGLQKVPQLIDRIESLGQQSVAITDHGTLSGSIEFYKACKARGIRPIIGLETYVAPRKHTDKNSAEDRNPYHLTLLAKNNQGYQNLMKLSTIASLEGFYYKPRVDHDLLEKYSDGLVVLSGCLGGELSQSVLHNDLEKAEKLILEYQDIHTRFIFKPSETSLLCLKMILDLVAQGLHLNLINR